MQEMGVWFAENMNWFWLAICIIAIVAELATSAALVSIWFAVGAFFAMLTAMAGAETLPQWMVFAVVSLAAMILFRRKAVRSVNRKAVATNADRIIGREGRVKERISNLEEQGSVVVDGQEWTARTKEDGVEVPAGSLVRVLAIAGVKAIVEPVAEKSAAAEQQKQ